jgi:hypothetical protein
MGTLVVRTYRDGVAQRVGHDLVIDVGRWWAKIEVGDDGAPTSIAFEVDPISLAVREGLGGVKPLTEKDRAGIGKDIDEKILRGRPISFTSSALEQAGEQLTAIGQLTLVGISRPASFQLHLSSDGHVTSTLPVNQSEWGIKPYRAFMGALKVRDTVEVVLDARLPVA